MNPLVIPMLGVLLPCMLVAGCIAPPAGEPHPQISAPPIAGTLYVYHPSDRSDGQPVVDVWRNGKRIAHPPPATC